MNTQCGLNGLEATIVELSSVKDGIWFVRFCKDPVLCLEAAVWQYLQQSLVELSQ